MWHSFVRHSGSDVSSLENGAFFLDDRELPSAYGDMCPLSVLCPFCFLVGVFVAIFVDGVGEVVGTRNETWVDKVFVLLLTNIWNQLCKFVYIINKLYIYHFFPNDSSKSGLIGNNLDMMTASSLEKSLFCARLSLWWDVWTMFTFFGM